MPNFRRPPVTEVAISFAFAPLASVDFAALADLRDRWRTIFPVVSEQPYLEPPQPPQTIRMEFGLPPKRIWFVSEQGDRIVQVQRDRFISNWRALPGGDGSYPRYEGESGGLRAEFLAQWRDFISFLANRSGGVPAVNQAEVTYINTVGNDDGTGEVAIEDVLGIQVGIGGSGQTRSIAYSQAWAVPEHKTVLSVAANRPGPAVTLEITATSTVDSLRDTESALDIAHEYVVGTFGVITTSTMQKRWERHE